MIKLLLLLVLAINSNGQETPRFPRYVGIGYDVVVGNPKTNRVDGGFRNSVFQHTYDNGKMTENYRFLVPDKMVARMRNSCSFTASTQEFTGVNSYHQSLNVLVDVSTAVNAWLVEVSFSSSVGFQSMRESTTERESMVFDSQAECEVYSLEMDIFDPPPLVPGFINAITEAHDFPHDTAIWRKIIGQYGTHYVSRGYFGGRMNVQSTLHRTSVQELTAMNVNVRNTAGLRYRRIVGDINVEVEQNEEQINAFEQRTTETSEIYIGGRPPRTGDWHDWYDEVEIAPMPVQYSVVGLSRLISRTNFPDFSATEIDRLRTTFDKQLYLYCAERGCTHPDLDRPLPLNVTFAVQNTPVASSPNAIVNINFQDQPPPFPFMNVRTVFVYRTLIGTILGDITGLRFQISDGINNRFNDPHGNIVTARNETWNVPQGEVISQVEVTINQYVRSIQFFTNRGTKSTLFGTRSGTAHLLNLNGHLVGMRGQFTTRFDAIGFMSTLIKF